MGIKYHKRKCHKIPGFPGYRLDEANQCVWSFHVKSSKGGIDYTVPPTMMEGTIHESGYHKFGLRDKNNKLRVRGIHQIIMLVHEGLPPTYIGKNGDLMKMDVRHLDGDCKNNALSNLAYGTRMENIEDMKLHGTSPDLKGSKHSRCRLTEEDVRTIRVKHASGTGRTGELAIQYGMTPSTISNILARRIWKHI